MSGVLRRSELATPASNDRMFAKAAASAADLVFLDLEDACAPAQRVSSRPQVVAALNDLDWGHTVRAVRVNGVDTHWCHGDVIEVVTGAGANLDTIIVPKARTARDVWWVSVLLDQLEVALGLTKRVRLEALIEDVEGLANAEEIARASDRLDALIFGAGDFSVSQGARVDTNFVPLGEYPGDFWHYARAKVVVAARIAGIAAIDAPYPDYQDGAGYERDARRAGLMGFTGKWCIHPSQIIIANEVYAPTPEEVALAERNVKAWHEGEARGVGAVGVDGVLVDAAHLKLAENTLSRARLIDDATVHSRVRRRRTMSDNMDISTDGGVTILRLNRPEQRNAVNPELHTELTQVWGKLAADRDLRAVLLCGAGGAFSAGGDADWLYQVATDQYERTRSLDEAKQLVGEMLRFPMPIVAAVRGPAVGLGSSLASLCDLVVMGENSFFADPHVALGVVAGDGAVVTWPALMSMMRAKEFLYTGAKIRAQQALELGLACRVVPDEQVLDEAMALAQRLAAQPAAALRATKRALNMQLERASIGVMDYACATEAETFTLPDFQERYRSMLGGKATGSGPA